MSAFSTGKDFDPSAEQKEEE